MRRDATRVSLLPLARAVLMARSATAADLPRRARRRLAVGAMLQAPHWQRRRERFAQLLETVRGRRQPLVALPVEVLPPASIRGAGPLGWLTADLVCAVVEQLARLAETDAPAAVRDVAALLGACRYVEACFREHGDSLRLDVAARGQTALVPRHLSTAARPYLDQLMLEERSRFDVRMLESAVNAMVTHCGGQHCRGARWAHNRRLERPAPERPPTPLLAAVLEGNRPPRVRVAWTARAWALPTPPDCEQCWIGINDAPNGAFELIRVGKHPARVLDPRSELDQVERFRGTAPAPEMNVSAVCISPCGRWIAVASRTRPPPPGGEPPPAASSAWGAVDDPRDDAGLGDAQDQRMQTCVCLWRVASGVLACTRQVPHAPRVRAAGDARGGGHGRAPGRGARIQPGLEVPPGFRDRPVRRRSGWLHRTRGVRLVLGQQARRRGGEGRREQEPSVCGDEPSASPAPRRAAPRPARH